MVVKDYLVVFKEGDGMEENRVEMAWFEEIEVTADELLKTIKGLLREVTVRKIVIQNNQNRVLIEIPLVIGLAGIALLPVYAASALFGVMVSDYKILVGRVGEKRQATKAR